MVTRTGMRACVPSAIDRPSVDLRPIVLAPVDLREIDRHPVDRAEGYAERVLIEQEPCRV
jgi:fumarylacetoacetate (FAA) hydrolase family protein